MTKFVHGNYAWGMTEALMVAYNVGADTLPAAVENYLQNPATRPGIPRCVAPALVPAPWVHLHPELAMVHRSSHPRMFKVRRRAMGDIALFHLWLNRPSQQPTNPGSPQVPLPI